jgi:hypothetical protein
MRAKTTLHGQLVALKLMPIVLLVIAFASAIQLWIHTVDAIAKTEHQTAVISSAQVLLELIFAVQRLFGPHLEADAREKIAALYGRGRISGCALGNPRRSNRKREEGEHECDEACVCRLT